MKAMQNTNVVLILALALMSCTAARGQEFWEKKPYQTWSEEECRKLLSKSPWAQSHKLTEVIIQPLQAQPVPRPLGTLDSNIENARSPEPLARADVGRAREARPQLTYQAQLRSALPIRQAIVRLSQIKARYEELSADQKRDFDKTAEDFLAKRFADSLILYVSYHTNVPIDDRELAQYWQTQTVDTFEELCVSDPF